METSFLFMGTLVTISVLFVTILGFLFFEKKDN